MKIIVVLGILLTLDLSPLNAALEVWTVTETRHVLRSEKPGNTREVKLSAARNEWESFQVFLRSDQAMTGVNLEPGELRNAAGNTIPVANIHLYRQHQLFLDTGTYRNTNFHADWYPDPLIPFAHPLTGKKLEGRIQAVPFQLPANETHGFWVDVYVPASTVPGNYSAMFRLTANGQAVQIPVAMKVWNFTLPPTPTLVTSFGSPRLRDYYAQLAKNGQGAAPPDWVSVEEQCAALLSENHFNAAPPSEWLRPVAQADGSFRILSANVQRLQEFVDRYHLNAIQTPHPSSIVKDPEAEREKLHRWLRAFDTAAAELKRTNVIFYTYLRDEPNTLEDYRYVQKWGRAVREGKSALKVMVVEQPWTEPGLGGADSAWGDLFGAVDIWCPLFSLHRPEAAAKRQALGEQIWTYTALCQGKPTPWWHIDFPLLNYRVPAWMAWRDHMTGLLYWGGMSYWKQVEDPWTQAPFYTGSGKPQQGQKGIVFQGEGSLVYPARAVGYDGVVPTIRLKALRDSIEDYEYLSILEKTGKREAADAIVHSVAESFYVWDKNPATYQTARARLAELIVSALAETNLVPDIPKYSNALSLAEIRAGRTNLVPLASVGSPEQFITVRIARELLDRNGIGHTTFPETGSIFILVRRNDFYKARAVLQNDIRLKGRAIHIAEKGPQ